MNLPNQKGFANIIGILIVAIFFGGLGLAFYKGYLTLNTSPAVPQNPTTPSISPTPQPTSVPSIDKTVNWKVFNDDYYKISFQYPETWDITPAKRLRTRPEPNDVNNPILLKNKNGDVEIKVSFGGSTMAKSLKEMVANSPPFLSGEPLEEKYLTINGVDAIKLVFESKETPSAKDAEVWYWIGNGDTYLVRFHAKNDKYLQDFDKFINSVRFNLIEVSLPR